MKKEYIMPRAYDLTCEGEELMETSLTLYNETVGADAVLSRKNVWDDDEE